MINTNAKRTLLAGNFLLFFSATSVLFFSQCNWFSCKSNYQCQTDTTFIAVPADTLKALSVQDTLKREIDQPVLDSAAIAVVKDTVPVIRDTSIAKTDSEELPPSPPPPPPATVKNFLVDNDLKVNINDYASPLRKPLARPYTKEESIKTKFWINDSEDYPYFGAPRSNGRKHGGIDIYPTTSEGTEVYSMGEGTVTQIIPRFLVRKSTGEVTIAVMIRHKDFIALYGEIKQQTAVKVGDKVKKGQYLGKVSGTQQLHLELYKFGFNDYQWYKWYDKNQPDGLMNPIPLVTGLMKCEGFIK